MAKNVIQSTPSMIGLPSQRLFEPLSWLRGEFDRLFDDLSFRNVEPSLLQGRAMRLPALEMEENDNHYRLTAELPGLTADDVDISVNDGILTISGEKKEEHEEKDKGFMFSERSYGRFERSVQLPANADEERIAARFENGVLAISIGKNVKADRKKKIAIAKA